ncbi:olfactory receptor [Culex quinquefasciatus]|uniref:Odorant receptor n=1 Tax=Culex quinquefasciatus TaxID=7176 RepID=B0WES7_CULQU|nr:olfactory receptor [Culex quinquefasciatus]|eukprot:XP_001847211.1 olfactory receptor [Culex quinquefasciatus]
MELEHYLPEPGSSEQNDKSIFWLRTLSTSLGIWPEKMVGENKSWWKRLYYFMIINAKTITTSMHWYNTYLQVEFFCANMGELKTITEGLCSFCSITVTGIKIMRLHSFSDEIYIMLQQMKGHEFLKSINFLKKGNNKDIFTKIDKIMKAKWREVNLNLRLYSLSVGVVAGTYSIVPAVINLVNLFQGNDIPKRFVYKTYYRYMEEAKYHSPLHELLFCSESLSGFTTWAGVISFDGLYVLLTMHLVTMFSSLNLIIKETSNANFNDAEKQFFLHEFLVAQVFTSTSIICVIAFHTSANASERDSQTLVMILYLIAAFYQLLQFCWNGQRVQNESVELPKSVYECDWYKCSKKFKTTLHILLLDVQKTVDISAYNMFVMSLETYLAIVKTAVSYFTALQTLTEE